MALTLAGAILASSLSAARAQIQINDHVSLVEDPQANFIDFQMVVRAGCADEAGGCRGIAHYLEHLILAGRDGRGESNTLPTFPGMVSNGWTTTRATAYTHRVPLTGQDPKSALERLFRFYVARLQPFEIPKVIEERERQIVLQEYDWRLGSSPVAPMLRRIDQQLFAAHPLGAWPIGERNEILALTAADAKAFHASWYHLPNVAFVVRGNLAPDFLRSIAENALAGLPNSAKLPARPSAEPVEASDQRLDLFVREEKATRRSIVMRKLIRMTPRDEMAELAAVTVLNHLLGSRLPGSLHDFVVEQKKIANEQIAASLSRIQPGLFLLDLRTDVAEGIDAAQLAAAMEAFLSEAPRLTPSARNIERMRRRSLDAARETEKAPERVYPQLVQWLAAGRSFADFPTMPEHLERVSDAEIGAFYTAFSGPGRLVIGTVFPPERAKP